MVPGDATVRIDRHHPAEAEGWRDPDKSHADFGRSSATTALSQTARQPKRTDVSR
jgi:hypothetical protein